MVFEIEIPGFDHEGNISKVSFLTFLTTLLTLNYDSVLYYSSSKFVYYITIEFDGK